MNIRNILLDKSNNAIALSEVILIPLKDRGKLQPAIAESIALGTIHDERFGPII